MILIFLIVQLVACSFMTGLIWTIQVLHYPTFNFVSKDRFLDFHAFHSKNISFIVMPVMIVELLSALALAIRVSQSALLIFNAVAVVAIWLVTFFVSVPLHNALSLQMGEKEIHRLVITNWMRTALWSTRLLVLGYFMATPV